MHQIVRCDGCGKAGQFDIKIEFEHTRNPCKSCAHDSTRPFVYYFCILPCLVEWMAKNKVATSGFPCQLCVDFSTGLPNGFFSGIKDNGPCYVCGGQRALKGRLTSVDPFDAYQAKKKG